MKESLPTSHIQNRIFVIRGHKVMLDTDLADIYGVSTKRLNEQVKRNADRFPDDFMFALTTKEKSQVVANCDHLEKLKYSSALPFAFTEHGALMLASVLKSQRAIKMSLYVVRTFVKFRETLSIHHHLSRKLDDLENKYDSQFRVVFDALRELMKPQPEKHPRIEGFK